MKTPVTKADKDNDTGKAATVVLPPAEPVGGALTNTTGTVDNQPKNNDATGAGDNDSKQQAPDTSLNTADSQTNSNATTGAGDNDGNDNSKQLMPDVSLNDEAVPVLIVTASSSRRRIGRRFPAGEPVEIPADELTESQIKELMADPVLNLTPKSM